MRPCKEGRRTDAACAEPRPTLLRHMGTARQGCRALQFPKAPSDEGAVSRQADWGRDTGGHTGPPLQRTPGVQHRTNGGGKPPPYRIAPPDTSHTMIRHCEEGRRPDVAIRPPVQENGFPRPLRGLGMTRQAHDVRLRAATRGRPYEIP